MLSVSWNPFAWCLRRFDTLEEDKGPRGRNSKAFRSIRRPLAGARVLPREDARLKRRILAAIFNERRMLVRVEDVT